MQVPRIDLSSAQGLADKAIGLVKEVVGTLTGQDRLAEAGRVQQEKGTERLKALEHELQAQAHKAKADAAETRQRSAQAVKEASS